MIESITIADVATYDSTPQLLDGLSQFTFVFGSNASGKTTISRVIADEDSFPTCKVTWQRGTRLQPMVYNLDFVDKNFHQSAQLKGVFTLGEKHEDILMKIAAARTEVDVLTRKIETLTHGLQGDDGTGGKKGELATLESALKDKCWEQKQKHDAALKGAFEGYRGSAEKFKSKVIHEWASNSAMLVSLAELEKRAETVFGPTPVAERLIPLVETATLVTYESDPILKKRVIGKDDVDIAALIKKLGNSDWVREGRTFYEVSEGVCPFCQQSTKEAFAQSLNEYFDEAFETDSKAIEELSTNYKTESARIQQQIAEIIATPPKFLDATKLKAEKELFDSRVTINIQQLAGKKREPSQSVELESLSNVSTAIKTLVDDTNALVAEHNKMVANLSQERIMLTAQVWKYLLEEELKGDLAAYKSSRDGLNKAIVAMETQIKEAKTEKERKQTEIREFERQTTSIQPTIDEINALLSSFGFRGFFLAKAEDGASYKLVRSDGSDAKATLSEGERSFVTFLYFYHLLKGSDSESGITTDRVVVFDDPVSSLDSDILFIVGSLIKGVFEEVRAGSGHIKQVFVLTHNVYFHREVTFNPRRRDVAMSEETFWVVRKPGLLSELEKCPSNPIKTSYELLWSEVRRSDRSNVSIQNTLRRILENYFKILGGFDMDQLCGMFAGKEKMICRSLCSWVHAGSHYALDDLYVSIDDSMVNTYLKVFKGIFEKAGHIAHYKMMMGDASEGDAH
ncbi:MAG: AAA family ATPase [Proteobacteria bacterium]|nr:AAA family ATPase [Pseudomonadota bacterium]